MHPALVFQKELLTYLVKCDAFAITTTTTTQEYSQIFFVQRTFSAHIFNQVLEDFFVLLA